jgi:N-acetylglucosamine-6-phosphate deacetylase
VPCFIEDGVAKLLDRSAFAGSIATADRLIRTFCSAGIPLADAVKMITETPARIMGLSDKGVIKEGNYADIVIFDGNINIKSVILQGKTVL